MSEAWVHHYKPETSRDSGWKQSFQDGFGGRRCFGTKGSEVDCNCKKDHGQSVLGRERGGILLINYFEKGTAITREYYSNPLDQLDAKIYEKRLASKKKRTSFPCTTQLRTKVR
ncbi:hypothetical protein TNCV_3000881 [Trichonephila clavipes]|nr:hypothetical protein TNCV_3000881 [Trichonephila clavipes]